jgi:ABC-type phosphate transport system substrate-binding protein
MKLILRSAVAGALLFSGEVSAEELAIIGNQYYPVDHVTKDTVKEIYLGKKAMVGAIRIKPLDQKEPVVRKKFLEEVLGIPVVEYNSYWIKKVFQDGTVPPVVKQSSQEVIEEILSANIISPLLKKSSKDVIAYVQKNAGAVGYVWEKEAVGIAGLKVLLVVEVGDRK